MPSPPTLNSKTGVVIHEVFPPPLYKNYDPFGYWMYCWELPNRTPVEVRQSFEFIRLEQVWQPQLRSTWSNSGCWFDFSPYPGKSPYIEPGAPEIQEAITDITGGHYPSPIFAVRCVYDWRQVNLSFDWRLDDRRSAVEILRDRNGNCGATAKLFAALVRAAGIPCRILRGYCHLPDVAYEPGHPIDYWYHVWPEVFLPECGWFPVDPNIGREWNQRGYYFGSMDNGRLVVSIGSDAQTQLRPGGDHFRQVDWFETALVEAPGYSRDWRPDLWDPEYRIDVQEIT